MTVQYSIMMETTDWEDADFQQFLSGERISFKPTGRVNRTPGGGEDVVYTATSKTALEFLLTEYFGGLCNCGDEYTGKCSCIARAA